MLTCTAAAAEHIQKQLICKEKKLGLRIDVKKTGCSGLAYSLALCDALEPGEMSFSSNGVLLITNEAALPFINGTCLDYVSSGLSAGFAFNNPNETARCGCGESFKI